MSTTKDLQLVKIKRNPKQKLSEFQKAVEEFKGGSDNVRTLVTLAGGIRVRDHEKLKSMAKILFDSALRRSDGAELKQYAILARRLSDRLARFEFNGCVPFSFSTAVFELCSAEFDKLCSSKLQPTQLSSQPFGACGLHSADGFAAQEFNDENQSVTQDVPVLANQPVCPDDSTVQGGAGIKSETCGMKVEACSGFMVDTKYGEESEKRDGAFEHQQCPMARLERLQIFSACLYTQDVVPEDFIHKIIDFHRFSGSSEWSSHTKNVALGNVVCMMTYCGKRLEKLGLLKHVMPDFYNHLSDLRRDTGIPGNVRQLIGHVLTLRENGWSLPTETSEATQPIKLEPIDPLV